jgi:hypothetical protein
MLHSLAFAHVAADPAVLPKLFHTQDGEVDGVPVRAGEPVLDKAGEQVIIDYEWDLVYAADPAEAERTMAKNRAANTTSGKPTEPEGEDTRQRRILEQGITNAAKAGFALARLGQKRGNQVFGTFESVQALRDQMGKLNEILMKFGPVDTSIFVFDDDQDEDTE